jgi:hypothetical protein
LTNADFGFLGEFSSIPASVTVQDTIVDAADWRVDGVGQFTNLGPSIRGYIVVRNVPNAESAVGASSNDNESTTKGSSGRRRVTARNGHEFARDPHVSERVVFIVIGSVAFGLVFLLLSASKVVTVVAERVSGRNGAHVVAMKGHWGPDDPACCGVAQIVDPRIIEVQRTALLGDGTRGTARENQGIECAVVDHATTSSATVGERSKPGPLLA